MDQCSAGTALADRGPAVPAVGKRQGILRCWGVKSSGTYKAEIDKNAGWGVSLRYSSVCPRVCPFTWLCCCARLPFTPCPDAQEVIITGATIIQNRHQPRARTRLREASIRDRQRKLHPEKWFRHTAHPWCGGQSPVVAGSIKVQVRESVCGPLKRGSALTTLDDHENPRTRFITNPTARISQA